MIILNWVINMFIFNYNLNEQDYIRFNECICYNNKSVKETYNIFKFKLPVAIWILFTIYFVLYGNLKMFITITISYLIFWLIFMFFLGFTFEKYIKKIVKITVENTKKNGTLPYDTINKVNFNEKEIIEELPNKKNILKYEVIEKIIISNDYYYIFLNSIEAIIIPNTAVKTKKEKEKFYDFLCQKVGSDKIKSVI